MALIDHTNYSTTLKASTNPRGSSPNGNVYFDVDNNEIQLIGVNELAQINFGAGLVTNPLNSFDGITLRALYNFENSQRRTNETLRKYERGTAGTYRFAGAFNFVNGVKLAGTDRSKVRGSGWIEYANIGDGATNIDRIYHGVKSLVDIQAGTTPYYCFAADTLEATLQAATWYDFARAGDIDEAVQVYGNTTYDAGTTNFDYTTSILVVRVRSWAYNAGETTSVATGISEFSGFSAGYGVGETANANNTYTLANVYGGAQIAPWTGMALASTATQQDGFTQGDDKNFSWILTNTGGGTVSECAAFLDALALQDVDIDGDGTYNGRKGRVWYTRNSSGQVVTSKGLFIGGLSGAEKQNIVMTDDSNAALTYPYFPEVVITVGAPAVADPNAWYHVFYADGAGGADFDTASAVTVQDALGADVKGLCSAAVNNKISFSYAYDTNTQAGLSAGAAKDMVALVEGDGGVAQAIAYFTVTRTATIPVTCVPPTDNNA